MVDVKKSILIVEDDPDVRDVVTDCLTEVGYNVVCLGDGKSATLAAETQIFDLAIVDLGLPDIDGLDLTREFKSRSDIGIIILSGRSETIERIVGLEVGADDYLTKPFEPRELLARVRSLLRRKDEISTQTVPALDGVNSGIYNIEGWRFDTLRRELSSEDGGNVNLSEGEYDLFKVFVEHPNRVLTRSEIIELAYTNDRPANDRSVDISITRLRRKIERNSNTKRWIKTVRNEGYIFVAVVTGEWGHHQVVVQRLQRPGIGAHRARFHGHVGPHLAQGQVPGAGLHQGADHSQLPVGALMHEVHFHGRSWPAGSHPRPSRR